MLGPLAIDTYLPAFSAMGQALNATPAQMQQTLSAYLLGFGLMNLFHGALADSFGRRPVILSGVAVFTLASIGCALSQSLTQLICFRALQGLATGAGTVVSRAVIRDLFAPTQAQKMMSQVTLFFGAAPAVAPLIGGLLYIHIAWQAIFWFLAAAGALLWWATYQWLPETLHADHAQPFSPGALMRGYAQVFRQRDFVWLAIASGLPFNGMFIYVVSAPSFLGELLHLAPTEFFWFFCAVISGIMCGAALSGHMAGKITTDRQIAWGFAVMAVFSTLNVSIAYFFEPHVWWAVLPIAAFACGWSIMTPAITLLVLDLVPLRRGTSASLHAVIISVANGIVAGAIAPLVMHTTLSLALASFVLMALGWTAWRVVKSRA